MDSSFALLTQNDNMLAITLPHSRVSLFITSACAGYLFKSSIRFPSSKSEKSNPGATVQPTSENESSPLPETSAENQTPCGIAYWNN